MHPHRSPVASQIVPIGTSVSWARRRGWLSGGVRARAGNKPEQENAVFSRQQRTVRTIRRMADGSNGTDGHSIRPRSCPFTHRGLPRGTLPGVATPRHRMANGVPRRGSLPMCDATLTSGLARENDIGGRFTNPASDDSHSGFPSIRSRGRVLRLRGPSARCRTGRLARGRTPSPRAWYGFGRRCVFTPVPPRPGSLPASSIPWREGYPNASVKRGGSTDRSSGHRLPGSATKDRPSSGFRRRSMEGPPRLRGAATVKSASQRIT